MARIGIGIDDHNGWAIYVCVSIEPEPVVVQKGRFELTDGSCVAQPYHQESMAADIVDGEANVAETRRVAAQLAQLGLGHVIDEVRDCGAPAVLGIREAPLRDWPPAHRSVHADREALMSADAMLYNQAVVDAAESADLVVARFDRKTVLDRAATLLNRDQTELERMLSESAKTFGPPWRMDQRLAAAGAIVALST